MWELLKKSKGYYDLLNLANKLKDNKKIYFDCYGYGNFTKFQNKIDVLKLKNIQLNQFEENIISKMKNFDLLLSLSHREGLPVSFLENMSQAVPVIAYNIRGAKDLIINNHNGYLFERNNIQEVFDKIIYLSKNNDKLSEISKNSYNFIDKKFNNKNIAKIIAEFVLHA